MAGRLKLSVLMPVFNEAPTIAEVVERVRAVPLAAKEGDPAFDADYENVLSGKYPLSRMLYIYVAKKPNEPLPPLIVEFLRFVLSKEGQQVVIKDGYLPLPAKVSAQMLAQTK